MKTKSNIDRRAVYQRYRNNTMIPETRYLENLEYASKVKEDGKFPNGAVVECGVWKGGMIAGFYEVFGPQRKYVLLDSFKGLPSPNENDGQDSFWWISHPEHPRYFNNCEASSSYVRSLFKELALNNADIDILEGWFSDTLQDYTFGSIAFLHLDCDWYDSTYLCLSKLWDNVAPGGVIIIDDYYDWEGCRKAVHDFLSYKKARESIRCIGTQGGAMIRRLGAWDISESPHLL